MEHMQIWRGTMADNPLSALESAKRNSQPPVGFRSLRDEFDRMFRAMSWPDMNWRSGLANWADDAVGLRVDVAESEGDIQVTTDLPGIDEDEIDVSLVDDVLRIRAEKNFEKEDEGDAKQWHVVERSYGKFERAIRVPPGIDADGVKATFDKGVLTVSLPKPPESKETTKKIAVTSG